MISFVQKDENGNTLINGQLQQNDDGRPTEVSQYLWDKFQNNDTNLNSTIVVRDNAARDALMQQEGGSDFVRRVHDNFFNHRQSRNPDRNYVYNNPQGQWYQQQYGGVGMPAGPSPSYGSAGRNQSYNNGWGGMPSLQTPTNNGGVQGPGSPAPPPHSPVNDHGGVGGGVQGPGSAPYEGYQSAGSGQAPVQMPVGPAPSNAQNPPQPSSQGGMMADAMRQNALYGLLGLSGRGNPRGLLMSILDRFRY